jgi:hypothetical protein
MSARITVGIDNGQSGSVGILTGSSARFEPVPTEPYLHYGKKGTIGKRLLRKGHGGLHGLIWGACPLLPDQVTQVNPDLVRVYIERPFSGKFMNAVLPAHRFFEATIIVMEDLGLGYEVVDSGPWQKAMLGNVTGSAELKKASKLRGIQMYPQFRDFITKHGDADGLLMARYYHDLQS